jgi:hypothetical protein
MLDKELRMNLMNKLLVSLIFLVPVTTSCSSDPYPNAGKCETPGESKSVDERVAVCTGIEGKSKWYFEGKYFEDALLLSKLEYMTFGVDGKFFDQLEAEDLSDSFFQIDGKAELSVNDLANYATGDARWDALIEAQAKYEKAEELADYYFTERLRLIKDRALGKANEAEFLAATRDDSMQREIAAELRESRNAKAEVLRATLMSQYKITDKDGMLIFLSRYVKQLN